MIDRRMIPQLGCEISRLGYGGMRFPKNGDEVDVEEAVKLLRKAYDMGVNYFDTAVVYHKGESEKIFGKAFEIYDRSSYYLADKMSIWVCKDEQEMKDLFERQLKTLKTDYIDFYLVHSLNRNHYQKVKEFHCVEFLQEMKRQGKIKHLGFSFHDTYPVFTQILNDYDWDFVQIQLNYLDWQNQGAEQLYRELEKRNLPCMVMEPVRGGYLATLDEQRAKPFLEMEPNRSIASWAIRWVESLPQVTVVLSGMSDMAQLEDNVAMMTNFEPMNEKELEAVAKVVEEIRKVNDIPCTGCRYCMDCPMGVDIPEIFAIYSRLKIFGKDKSFVEDYKEVMENGNGAEHCVGCQQCMNHCPQSIEIPDKLAMIHRLYLDKKAELEAAEAAK
ncbi:MAG: aldo/keto reductase [Negativibacillus massiliensis]|mgnify:FL=1|uniref:aldo/keto reductase n=1 Tax=Negativibacillus massiliensis TaxID=1871035 RepID=UPI0023F44850|nr:aldo/keto reductase [Negativibacillus massiliensis]MCI6348997.1 aldo/keto reductase [Negativibacillus massiliensis]MDY4048509.1 aldo/keto reductase [Negativibacillus massiliensis]